MALPVAPAPARPAAAPLGALRKSFTWPCVGRAAVAPAGREGARSPAAGRLPPFGVAPADGRLVVGLLGVGRDVLGLFGDGLLGAGLLGAGRLGAEGRDPPLGRAPPPDGRPPPPPPGRAFATPLESTEPASTTTPKKLPASSQRLRVLRTCIRCFPSEKVCGSRLTPRYCRPSIARTASAGSISLPVSASSAIESCTPLITPLNSFPTET